MLEQRCGFEEIIDLIVVAEVILLQYIPVDGRPIF